jgi:hypothetical protein
MDDVQKTDHCIDSYLLSCAEEYYELEAVLLVHKTITSTFYKA